MLFKSISRKTPSLAILAIVAGLIPPADAATGKNVVLSAPFEVGASPAGNYLAALVAGADTDTLAAATFFREALRYDSRNRDLIERTFVASLTNANMPEGFALAQRLLKYDRKNGLAHLALAVKAFKARQWAAARKELASGGGGSRDVTVLLLNAWSWAGAGDTKRALATLDQLRDDRFAAFRDFHAGLIADIAGNIPEATKRFKSAYEGEKTSLRVVDTWARFLSRHGDRDEARKVYEEFSKLLPRHPIVVAALKDLDAGKALDQTVSTPVAGAGEVLYGLGSSGGQGNDSLASMIYLRLGLYLSPDNGLAIVTLADAFERLKQYERAVDVYNSMPERSPLRGNSDIQTALVLEATGRSDDALSHMKGIVAERPADVDAVTALGNLYRARKQWTEAAAAYSKAIDLIPSPASTDWTLFYSRGVAYERSKQWPLAEVDFKKALELKPDQPQVLNYLGYSWVDRGENLDEAFRMLRKAVDQSRGDGYIVDSLGWAYFKLGRFDDARRELEAAIELKPGDPVINDHLGDVYWKVGRKLEAHFQWNHARDMKPDPEDLDRILKKIESGLPDDVKTENKPDEAPAKNGG